MSQGEEGGGEAVSEFKSGLFPKVSRFTYRSIPRSFKVDRLLDLISLICIMLQHVSTFERPPKNFYYPITAYLNN